MIYELDIVTTRDTWKTLGPLLEPALHFHPSLDIDDLFQILMAGRAQAIVLIDEGIIQGAIVMEIVQYPSHLEAVGIAMAGKRMFLRRYMDEFGAYLIQWSRARNCDRISFMGRPGWERFVQRKFPAFVMAPAMRSWQMNLRPESVVH